MKTKQLYRCELCREEFPFEGIRYSSDGKRIVCVGCYNKKSEGKKEEPIENAPELVKLICIDCRYKFSFKKGSKVKVRCPYCGKTNLIRNDLTADRLIEEASHNIV